MGPAASPPPGESGIAQDSALPTLPAMFGRIRAANHSALCLSGGGMRSAAFALGVVQGLARHGVLGKFTYLSTVSGGGYTGGWLSAWMARSGPNAVCDALGGRSDRGDRRIDPEPEPVRHLRAHSNFLAPRLGLLSADTWALIATLLRNLLLTWLVLLPPLAALLLVPRLAASMVALPRESWEVLLVVLGFDRLRPMGLPAGWLVVGTACAIATGCATAAIRFVHRSRPLPIDDSHASSDPTRRDAGRAPGQRAFLWWGLAPLVCAAVLFTAAWAWAREWELVPVRWQTPLLVLMALGAAIHALGFLLARRPLHGRRAWAEPVAVVLTGALSGAGAYGAGRLLITLGENELLGLVAHEWYAMLALPLLLGMLLVGSELFLGLMSRWMHDGEREWSARFHGWVLICGLVWLVASALVFGGPAAVAYLIYVASAAGLSGMATALLGGSAMTPGSKGGDKDSSSGASLLGKVAGKAAGAALALAAPIFAASTLVLLATADTYLLSLGCAHLPGDWCGPPVGNTPTLFLNVARGASPALVVALGLGLALISAATGWLIDTNKFSLHSMYRSRLVRAFPGASRPRSDRRPDPFTGFDDGDNPEMHQLWPARAAADAGRGTPPLHVVNVALNLVGGDNLAWQERKAESFTVSPLHAGSLRLGYRRVGPGGAGDAATAGAQRWYGGKRGISLGTALTISGAAASPNMGYHSSPAVGFLLTLLNARLGWWLGNPGPAGERSFDRRSPSVGLGPIFAELFGRTDNRNKYVYLSDGGHFENLGAYEMVLRRCRLIVVSDAGADPTCSLEDLGNLVRKARIDLGVPIEFGDDFAIRARDQVSTPRQAASSRYWAIGRIRYSCVDRAPGDPTPDSEFDGTLIYLKPAFYGTEPRDVFNYARRNPTFPHQTTGDQFFSESQFESYRGLGSHIIDRICDASPTGTAPVPEPQPGTPAWFEFRARYYDALRATPVPGLGTPAPATVAAQPRRRRSRATTTVGPENNGGSNTFRS